MESTVEKPKKAKKEATNAKSKTGAKNKKKSKIALFWEEYPDGIIEILDMRAVLK